MVSYYDKVRIAARQPTIPPLVAKLQGIFDALDDAELIKALRGRRRRGCQGYSVQALWRSYLTSYILNVGSVRELIRHLENNPTLCELTGISPWAIPSESTYSRFVAKLSKRNDLVQETLHKAVNALKDHLEDFGKVVAIDSTDLKASSSGSKNKISDNDARWSAKRKKGNMYWWFGYKVHMVSDATHELPIHVEVTPANVSDYHAFTGPLSCASIDPDYVLADAGYDSKRNHGFVIDEFNAIPIIQLNKRGKRKTGRTPKRSKVEIRLLDMRQNPPGIERDGEKWMALYTKRTSVERLFSRMKECRRLTRLRHRGIEKVTLHAYLSTLTIAASALSAIYSEQPLRMVA